MPLEMPKCKITVLKRTVNQDLADEYLEDMEGFGPCERFEDGQEFIIERPFDVPERTFVLGPGQTYATIS